MPRKTPAADADDKTSVKLSKELARRLARIAAHKSMSLMALAEEVLSRYADDETVKMIAEIKAEGH